jgi:peroxiredoxin
MAEEQITGESVMPAPDFTLRDTQGREASLSGYRGRPVVLVFTRSFR